MIKNSHIQLRIITIIIIDSILCPSHVVLSCVVLVVPQCARVS